MKNCAYLSLLLFNNCWSASQELSPKIILNKNITSTEFQNKQDAKDNNPTHVWFSIESICSETLQATIRHGEENAKCLCPFKREYKETWQINTTHLEQFKNLDPVQDHRLLWSLLRTLANTTHVKISIETITDNTMVSFGT